MVGILINKEGGLFHLCSVPLSALLLMPELKGATRKNLSGKSGMRAFTKISWFLGILVYNRIDDCYKRFLKNWVKKEAWTELITF
jgi:hypothetical protein